jgi:uncharacterized membrane protein
MTEMIKNILAGFRVIGIALSMIVGAALFVALIFIYPYIGLATGIVVVIAGAYWIGKDMREFDRADLK